MIAFPQRLATPSSALLVVFPESGLRRSLAHGLRREGFGVVVASTTKEALALLSGATSLPCAVVFDLAPEDGRQLEQALEAMPRWAPIPQLAFASVTEHRPRRALVEPPILFSELVLQLRRITGVLN